jgi:DNA-binding helix-hairpin-helix protein with protein kinase domain
MAYVTDQAATVALRSAFARGAVGDLYEIIGETEYVAKIYHKPLNERAERKLRALIDFMPKDLLDLLAWPLTTLRPGPGEPIRGVVMRRIEGMHSLYDLDSPSQRRLSFPHADWKFLLRVARNCAALVNAVHQAGIVLGDVQTGRFLVDEDGDVQLVDCDSCQITVGEETFHCLRITPQYRAPELQNAPLEAFPQTTNHDAFGLAVVIYRLLMMGRHPFVGYQGADKMTIARAIEEYRFALGSNALSLVMTPPPHAPMLKDLTPEVANYFVRAFDRGSQREGARPTAAQWVDALAAMERQLRPCPADPGHQQINNGGCPWCRIEQEGGPVYFSTVTAAAVESRPTPVDVKKFSARLDVIPTPDKLLAQAMHGSEPVGLVGRPLPPGTYERQTAFYALLSVTLGSALLMLLGRLSTNFFYIGLVLTIVFSVATLIAFVLSPLWHIRRQRRKALVEKQAAWQTAERQAKSRADRVAGEFAAHYKATVAERDRLQALQEEETRDMKLLQASARERQLEQFLAGFSLRAAKLEHLDEDRLLILQSHGVETARDVRERTLASIRGLSDTLPGSLLTWRKAIEGRFAYDDRRGLPAVDVARVRNKYLERRLELQEPLEIDVDKLERLAASAREEAALIAEFLIPYRTALAQAKLDLEAAPWRRRTEA